MKRIEEGQPFVGTVRFRGVDVTGEWVKVGEFLYFHLDPKERQDTSIAATIRTAGGKEHTIAIPLAAVDMIIIAEEA